jgi:hypothetical protein
MSIICRRNDAAAYREDHMKHRKWATTAAMLVGLLLANPAMAGPLDWLSEGWEGIVSIFAPVEEETFHPVPQLPPPESGTDTLSVPVDRESQQGDEEA